METSQETPPSTASSHAVGTTVLVYDGPLLYDARILEVMPVNGGQRRAYRVHFVGWNASWDAVVDESSVLERSAENMALAKRLFRECKERLQEEPADVDEGDGSNGGGLGARRSPRRSGVSGQNGKAGGNSGGGRRGNAAVNWAEGVAAAVPALEAWDPATAFDLPMELKQRVLDDFDTVSERQQLLSLPREPNVAQILNSWVQSSARTRSLDRLGREFAQGLQSYFDAALGRVLLYQNERLQYQQEVEQRQLAPSQVYGGEHLLRLLVKLPWFLEHTPMGRDMLQKVSQLFADLCKFLTRHMHLFFSGAMRHPAATETIE